MPDSLTYHNLNHTKEVAAAAVRIAREEKVSDENIDLLHVAALFHDAGYIYAPEGHEQRSCEIARSQLPAFQFSAAQIEIICSLIMATRLPREPKTLLEEIICDADLDYLGTEKYAAHAQGLFLELKAQGSIQDKNIWNQRQLSFLEKHRYFTASAKAYRNAKKAENILKLSASMAESHQRFSFLGSTLWDYALMLLGVTIAAFGLQGFLAPNNFLDGGVTGLSLLVHDLYGYPLAAIIILANIPFLIVGRYVLNTHFALKAFVCVCALSTGLVLLHRVFPDSAHAITDKPLLIAVFGGFFLGMGMGVTMRAGFALDGIEILALYTLKRTSFSISEIILAINVFIFTVAAISFQTERALYAMITYFVASHTIDYVIEGWEAFTGVTIISEKSEAIKRKLVMEMGRGITVYKGERGFLPGSFEVSHDCDIIFTVITRLEIRRLKNMVHSLDPRAFVFVSSIKETSGGIIKRKNMH